MNRQLLAINGDFHAVWNVGEIPDRPIFCFDDDVIAGNVNYFAPLHLDRLGRWALLYRCLSLYLSVDSESKADETCPHQIAGNLS